MTQYADVSHLAPAVAGSGLIASFQPIVQLADEAVVGYEALARWPGIPGATPDLVFAAAELSGRTAELDLACQVAALRSAMDVDLGVTTMLFVNVEPGVEEPVMSAEQQRILTRSGDELRVFMEITERSLLAHPHVLLSQVRAARDRGWQIALDDVGAHPDSLAMLDLLAPDVVKLDLNLIQRTPHSEQARTLAAVMAYAERTGIAVLAEGIETDDHLEQAMAIGAVLGQGWRFGRAGELSKRSAPVAHFDLPRTAPPTPPRTPFDLVEAEGVARTARKQFLVAFSRHLEAHAEALADRPIVLSALQRRDNFTAATRQRYERLAATCPFVAVLGRGIDSAPGVRVRGADLSQDDPLSEEWTVVVLSSVTAAALIARSRHDHVADGDRRFDFVVTYDRGLVTDAARSIMSRLS